MVIDEMLNRKFDCDLFLDQTFGRKQTECINLLPDGCRILLGSKFSLLRTKFSELRRLALHKRANVNDIQKILVSLGGSNITTELLPDILKGIESYKWKKNPEIDLILGTNLEYFNLDKSIKSSFDIQVYEYVDNIEELMINSDIAIGAAGTSTWERCCLGLPTITVGIAENQRDILENVSLEGGLYSIGCCNKISAKTITNALSFLVSDMNQYRSMVNKAFNICDGLGVNRVSRMMLSK